MPYREERKGRMAAFLVPSLKIKQRDEDGQPFEEKIHLFLMKEFGGYTASAGNVFGYWKDEGGKASYGEHREYKVALEDEERIEPLKHFLGQLAADLDEDCLYLEAGQQTAFIYSH